MTLLLELFVILGKDFNIQEKLISSIKKTPFWTFKKDHSHYLKHFYTISLCAAYEKQMLNVVSYNKWYGQ